MPARASAPKTLPKEFSPEFIEILRKEVFVLYLRAHGDFRAPEDLYIRTESETPKDARSAREAWYKWAKLKQ